MTREEFWTHVKEIGWGTKTTDSSAVKIELMRKGPEFCAAFREHFEWAVGQLYQAATKAGLDYCCDSWDDTVNHVIGLGALAFQANQRWPQGMVQRMEKGNYVESFAYCVPWPQDFTDYDLGNLLERAREYAQEYRKAKGRVPALDASIERLATLLESDDPVPHEKEARGLAEKITEKARETILRELERLMGKNVSHCWDGGDVLTNKWAVWNLYSDIHKAKAVAA